MLVTSNLFKINFNLSTMSKNPEMKIKILLKDKRKNCPYFSTFLKTQLIKSLMENITHFLVWEVRILILIILWLWIVHKVGCLGWDFPSKNLDFSVKEQTFYSIYLLELSSFSVGTNTITSSASFDLDYC